MIIQKPVILRLFKITFKQTFIFFFKIAINLVLNWKTKK